MSFRLSGEIKDTQLFKEIIEYGIPRGGKLFYRQDNDGNIVDAVYFSGAKRLRYTGEIDQELASLIRTHGSKVEILYFDESELILNIMQK